MKLTEAKKKKNVERNLSMVNCNLIPAFQRVIICGGFSYPHNCMLLIAFVSLSQEMPKRELCFAYVCIGSAVSQMFRKEVLW